MVDIIAPIVGAISLLGAAGFRFATARLFVKHAAKKDLPAIAREMYRPRLQFGGKSDPADSTTQDQDGKEDEPGPGS